MSIQLKRGDFLKTVQALTDFDTAGSPYVGMQIHGGIPCFHRSGRHGFVETPTYVDTRPLTAFSLPHMKAALLSLSAEDVELAVDTNGVVILTSARGSYKTVLRIHCTRIDQPGAWNIVHAAGKMQEELPHEEFKGIKTAPFPLAVEPVLRHQKLMLATPHAIVRRDLKINAFPWPRSLFLNVLTKSKPERLGMTDMGYWALHANGLSYMVSGHRSGEALAEEYDKPSTPLSELSAKDLLHGLTWAIKISGKSNRIQIDPEIGFIAVDEYGEKNTQGMGLDGIPRFAIYPGTAKVLADALEQDAAETAALGNVDADTMRISRGLWDITFKIHKS